MLKKVPFTIGNGAAVSGVIDLGAFAEAIAAISIDGTWTAAKVGFQAYAPGSGANEPAQFAPAVLGGATAWVGGPYDAAAEFNQVEDNTGAAVQYGNGTDTDDIYINIPEQLLLRGIRWIKVSSGTGSVNQGQAVTGYLLVRTK